MGYILELRKQVGHRPLIMTCAGVLLLNEKRELLLQKRALHNMCICSTYYVLPSTTYFIIVMGNGAVT